MIYIVYIYYVAMYNYDVISGMYVVYYCCLYLLYIHADIYMPYYVIA